MLYLGVVEGGETRRGGAGRRLSRGCGRLQCHPMIASRYWRSDSLSKPAMPDFNAGTR